MRGYKAGAVAGIGGAAGFYVVGDLASRQRPAFRQNLPAFVCSGAVICAFAASQYTTRRAFQQLVGRSMSMPLLF